MSEIPAGAMRFNSDSQKLEYWNGTQHGFRFILQHQILQVLVIPTPGPRGFSLGGRRFHLLRVTR